MKKLNALFIAIFVLSSFIVIKAQKVAHADVAGILTEMPEMKKANEELESIGKKKQEEMVKQQQALQTKAQNYQKEAASQSVQVNQQRESELQRENENLQKIAQAAQKDLSDRQATLYAPIDKKLGEAISAVAKEKGLEYIFDSNSQGLIYKNGLDVTADIKKKLGLK